MHRGEAGCPVGGSLEMSYALEERLLQLGGTIRYGTRVVGLRTLAERANGVPSRAARSWTPTTLSRPAISPGHAVGQVSLDVRTGW